MSKNLNPASITVAHPSSGIASPLNDGRGNSDDCDQHDQCAHDGLFGDDCDKPDGGGCPDPG